MSDKEKRATEDSSLMKVCEAIGKMSQKELDRL
jgi:hypothetical protein